MWNSRVEADDDCNLALLPKEKKEEGDDRKACAVLAKSVKKMSFYRNKRSRVSSSKNSKLQNNNDDHRNFAAFVPMKSESTSDVGLKSAHLPRRGHVKRGLGSRLVFGLIACSCFM
ncbi:uncharacterized protein G2W53_022984 [Senna tora]|uniref:Uncharacterized protein n=1 Tax=Senna tora TaxID=362788 RepID=A0A834WIU7_9FABA|nr:uncharacterized protein G2W53_022984 [Senna tora]